MLYYVSTIAAGDQSTIIDSKAKKDAAAQKITLPIGKGKNYCKNVRLLLYGLVVLLILFLNIELKTVTLLKIKLFKEATNTETFVFNNNDNDLRQKRNN